MSEQDWLNLQSHYWKVANEGPVGLALYKPRAKPKKVKPPAPPLVLDWTAAAGIAKLNGADALARIQSLWSILSGASRPDRPLRETEGGGGSATAGGAPDSNLTAAPDPLDAARGELAELLGLGVNTKSTPQVIALLDRLGLPKVFKRGQRGDESARTKEADVLLDLYLRTGHPVTVALLKSISLRSQIQELGRELDSDGRIRTSFVSCGTETDRTTSKKFLTGSGGNLQTIPKTFRTLFVPD